MAEPFDFELVMPERLLLAKPAVAVVVPGADGYFTVMKDHAPVLSSLRPGLLQATMVGGDEQHFFVRGGFADVGTEGLTVLAEEAVPIEQLDAERVAQSLKNAEEDIADADTAEKRAAAERRLEELREVFEALKLEQAH